MQKFQWTIRTKIVFFLSLLSFLHGFLFINMFTAFIGSALFLFLFYTKHIFEHGLTSITITQEIYESIRYVNHPIHVKTTITSKGTNVFLHITEAIPQVARITHGTNEHQLKITSSQQVTHSYQLVFHQRGRYQFPPVKLVLQDIMKLYCFTTTIPVETTILVHSDPKEIQKAKRASFLQDESLMIPSLAGMEEHVEFEGIQKYYPGDLLRHIDWKASSRLQELVTKTFEKKETVQTIIFLDVSQRMRRSLGSYTKLDHAIAIVIQLATLLQKQHHSVGFVAYDEYKVITRLAPSFDYQQIFNASASLPSSKIVKSYYPFFSNETPMKPSLDAKTDTQFLNMISSFISLEKKQVKSRLQTTGIYQALNPYITKTKKNHFVFITDLETNLDSFRHMLSQAHLLHHTQWVLTLFTPWYDEQKNQENPIDHVEQLYQIQHARELFLLNLQKKQIEILDLTPEKQGVHIMQTFRRKKK